jgi:segregation and condensation protein B
VSELASEPTSESARALEAILLVAQEPVEAAALAQLLELPAEGVEQLCAELADRCESQGRGMVLARVAGGWRFQTAPELSPYVERFLLEGTSTRLSAAALETLVIVAYKQPITRGAVGAIRGVNVDAVLRTLTAKGYVEEVGRDPGPGTPALYGTTRRFLEALGLDRIEDLPSLGDFVPSAEVAEALEVGLRGPSRDAAPTPSD